MRVGGNMLDALHTLWSYRLCHYKPKESPDVFFTEETRAETNSGEHVKKGSGKYCECRF